MQRSNYFALFFVEETMFIRGGSRAEKRENRVTHPPAAMSGFEASVRSRVSSARTATTNVFFQSLMKQFVGICRDLIQRVNRLSPAYTRCFRTRRVFSSPLISIRKAGARTQLRF